MEDTLSHPSWHNVDRGSLILANKIVNEMITANFMPGFIVGITRGGLIPATIISSVLDVPMYTVSYSSHKGQGDNKNHINVLPTITGNIVSGTGQLPPPPPLCLVDDICDSGYTLKEISDHYKKQGHTVLTAALYYKNTSKSVFKPDFIWKTIPADAPWIIFPWEV